MPHKQISELVLDGKSYLVIPKTLVESKAPQLLQYEPTATLNTDDTPWEILQRHLEQDVSMIQAWREYLQLSQQDVAKRLEINLGLYQQYEKSARPRRATLERVAGAMGISLTQLL